MSPSEPVTIVGGGYSGLTQAFYLVEAGYSVRLFEKGEKPGGLISSRREGEFLVETAANAMLANSEVERISKIIDVPLKEKLPLAKKRFIYQKGQMSRWPLQWNDNLTLASFVLKKIFFSKQLRPEKIETMKDWCLRTLNKDILQNLVEPALQGIYATGSENLNAHLIYDSLSRRPRKGRLRGSVSPQGGMGQWIEGLQNYLLAKGCQLNFGHEFDQWENSGPLIVAADLKSVRSFVKEGKIHLPESVLETRSLSLSTMVFCFEDQKKTMTEGFGCLFPKKENFHSLGVLFNHNIFSERSESGASETWILNDEKVDFSSMSPMALERYVQGDRYQLYKRQNSPDQVFCSQWPGRIPLYDRNLARFIEDYEKTRSQCLLMGNYLGDLGLARLVFRAQDNLKKIREGYFG